jgi:hypothetical protein
MTKRHRIATVLVVAATTVGGAAAAVGLAGDARAATAAPAATSPAAASHVPTFGDVNRLIGGEQALRGKPCSVFNSQLAKTIRGEARDIVEQASKHIRKTEDRIVELNNAIRKDRERLAHHQPGDALSKAELRRRIEANENKLDRLRDELFTGNWQLMKAGAQSVLRDLNEHYLKRCG